MRFILILMLIIVCMSNGRYLTYVPELTGYVVTPNGDDTEKRNSTEQEDTSYGDDS